MLYKKHSFEVVYFESTDVFASEWDGSTVDGDDTDDYGIEDEYEDLDMFEDM